MTAHNSYFKLLFVPLFFGLIFSVTAKGQDSIVKNTEVLLLGETEIKINVYERKGSSVTFIAPHYNEQIARNTAKEIVAKKGGRFIEIESFDQNKNPSRQLYFQLGAKSYNIDPNRIFTANGRNCSGLPAEIQETLKSFAERFLKIVLSANDGKSLRAGEHFIVAVHNNGDVDEKPLSQKTSDLTATAFIKNINHNAVSHNSFQEQAAGAYLSNAEIDEDNFVFLSVPRFINFFAEKGFNVVAQKPATYLQSKRCTVDDGSLSVFSALENIPYICLETDAKTGALRQRQMIESVYQLFEEINERKEETK